MDFSHPYQNYIEPSLILSDLISKQNTFFYLIGHFFNETIHMQLLLWL